MAKFEMQGMSEAQRSAEIARNVEAGKARVWSALQEAIFERFESGEGNFVVIARAGTGKCLGLGTPVMKADGSVVPVDTIIAGDRVMGPDGAPRVVQSTTKGRGPMYRITPVKGEPWTCNDVHVMTLAGTNRQAGKTIDIPLNQLIAQEHSAGRRVDRDWKLFRVPLDFAKSEVEVEPYLVGLWLGDGTADEAAITNADPEILEYCAAAAPRHGVEMVASWVPEKNTNTIRFRTGTRETQTGYNGVRRFFARLAASGEKRIPREYLLTDREARLQLLAGILDTDGHASCGGCEITQKSRGLADQVVFLARSLGFAAYLSEKTATIKDIGFSGTYYRIFISGDLSAVPCKTERMKFAPREQVKRVLVTGFTAEPIGDGDYYGFQLDGDGRFLLGDFTVTHNSTTGAEGINRASESNVWWAAYNKHIQVEMEKKLENPNAVAKTIHGVGYACIKRRWPDTPQGVGCQGPDGDRAYRIADEVLSNVSEFQKIPLPERFSEPGKLLPGAESMPIVDATVARCLSNWLNKAREVDPFAVKAPLEEAAARIEQLASDYDVLPEEEVEVRGWSPERLAVATYRAMQRAAAFEDRRFDFADMLFLPLVNGWTYPRFSMIVVDEAQDMNDAMLAFVRGMLKKNGRIALIGDPKQCAPAGSMVTMEGFVQKPIEEIVDGDRVVAFSRGDKCLIGKRRNAGFPVKVASRPYVGDMVSVKVGDRLTKTTPNHRWLVRWSPATDKYVCVTYLMRRGDRYRVGWCQLFCNAESGRVYHLGVRARLEGADCAWILKAFFNSEPGDPGHDPLVQSARTDASAYESIVAARYGLPTVTFNEVSGAQHLTGATIDRIFEALKGDDLAGRAARCLEAHGKHIDLPLYPPIGKEFGKMGRNTLFETYAANLEPALMAVPVPVDERGVEYKEIDSAERSPFSGPVYSLDVETHHSYVQDGLVTKNSIYGFRGADSEAMNRLAVELKAETLPLNITYRCPLSVVREAQRLVPDLQARDGAPEGVVREMRLVDLPAEVRAGDLVLSRVNAPLLRAALNAMKAGKPVRIVGKQIGDALVKLALKIERNCVPLDDFLESVEEYRREQVARLSGSKERSAKSKLEKLLDQLEALTTLADGMREGGREASGLPMGTDSFALVAKIRTFFSDTNPARVVSYSTIHGAKGLEHDRVFILRETLYVYGKRAGESEEANLEYVAITRAKKELVWVHGDFKLEE